MQVFQKALRENKVMEGGRERDWCPGEGGISIVNEKINEVSNGVSYQHSFFDVVNGWPLWCLILPFEAIGLNCEAPE